MPKRTFLLSCLYRNKLTKHFRLLAKRFEYTEENFTDIAFLCSWFESSGTFSEGSNSEIDTYCLNGEKNDLS